MFRQAVQNSSIVSQTSESKGREQSSDSQELKRQLIYQTTGNFGKGFIVKLREGKSLIELFLRVLGLVIKVAGNSLYSSCQTGRNWSGQISRMLD